MKWYTLAQKFEPETLPAEMLASGMFHGMPFQHHFGTLETANEAARQTEQANGNKIQVFVVNHTCSLHTSMFCKLANE